MSSPDALQHGASAALGQPFWRMWTASTISNVGSGLTYVAMPLLAASYTRDARLVAVVTAATYLPPLLFGLHSGALVDRQDRRRIMWMTDVVRAVLVGVLALLVVADEGGIWVLAAFAFGLGAAGIFFENAASAIMPMVVRPDQLERANAWLLSGQTIGGQFVGLPIGGALFAIAAALPFGADAVTYVIAIALVLTVAGSFRAYRSPDQPTTVWQDVREGASWLAHHRLLRTLALLVAMVNGAFAIVEAPLVLYVLEVLHAGRFGYALLLVMLAVGGILGSIVAVPLRRRIGFTNTITLSAVAMVVGIVGPGLSATMAAAIPALIIGGAAGGAWNVVTVSLRQRTVPAELLGRVTSAYRVAAYGVMPVGAAVGGFVAHAFGLRAPWIVAGVALAIAAAAAVPTLRSAGAEVEASAATSA